ncbi:MAG: prohibitin family protein [Bacteroidales bacterium]|nr:prohibitin family protein [Bacteroidales bacterium]MCF8387281.1 prohibitin family protein [Bacteroidales bacterium]MCF8396873.1 prohibitin family protein [Bacteroidales bacterium]
MAQQDPEINWKKVLPIGIIIVAVILLIIFWSSMTITIKAGRGGVLFKTFGGGVDTTRTYGEGFHFIAPWNNMFVYKVRQQEVSEEMNVLSSNGLEINVDVTTWYQPKWTELGILHQRIGENYLHELVIPALRSSTRTVIGRYTPDQLYAAKRDIIQDEIYSETKEILDKKYVQLNEILIRSIVLPPTIRTAIESKLKQEQEALEYEFKLEKAKQEAERQRIDAEGKAKANRILSASLTDKILKEKGIEATLKLAQSSNAKIVIVGGGKDGLPIILGDTK